MGLFDNDDNKKHGGDGRSFGGIALGNSLPDKDSLSESIFGNDDDRRTVAEAATDNAFGGGTPPQPKKKKSFWG